jgi:hypothetical protein
MRSEIIFRAQEKVDNRYRLCHAASKVSRCLHYYSATTQDAISDAFVRISHVPCLAQSALPPSVSLTRACVEDSHEMTSVSWYRRRSSSCQSGQVDALTS